MGDFYEHWSGLLTARDIGLGWLKTITMLRTLNATSMHRHAHSTVEVIFCLKGEFRYHLSGFGNVSLGAGNGIVIPARTDHELERNIEIPGERLSFFLNRRMQSSRKFAVFSASDYRRFHDRIVQAAGQVFTLPPNLLTSVRRLSEILGKDKKSIATREFALLRILVCSILYDTVQELDAPRKRNRSDCIDAAIRYLEANYSRKFRIDELISRIGYGHARFFALFREHTHLTPVEYLTRFRIARAHELLSKTDLPISQVAARVGIANPVYFTALFKHHTGSTPRQCRQTLKPPPNIS